MFNRNRNKKQNNMIKKILRPVMGGGKNPKR